MYYISLPFSRQVTINFLLNLCFCGLCAFIIYNGSAERDFRAKNNIANKEVRHVSSIIEHNVQRTVDKILHELASNQNNLVLLPPNFAYVEWNDLTNNKSYVKYITNWFIDENDINAFKEKSFKSEANFYVSYACNINCYVLIFRKSVINNNHGYAIAAIDQNMYVHYLNDLNPYRKLYLPLRYGDLNASLNTKLTKQDLKDIVEFNRNNNLQPNIGDLSNTKNLPTISSLITNSIVAPNNTQAITSPIIYRGTVVSHVVTYLPKFTFLQTLKTGIINNFMLTMLALALLIIIICYHLFNVLRLVRFFRHNRLRLHRYANIGRQHATSDEIYTLLLYLNKSLESNQHRDSQIENLNKSMSLYANYDLATGLPNAIWLKEQITQLQAEYRIDNSLTIYLIEFAPKLNIKKYHEDFDISELTREIASEISKVIPEQDRLSALNEESYGLLTTSLPSLQEVYALLDKIKEHLNNTLKKHAPCSIKAGILPIYNPNLVPEKLLEKTHIAYSASIASEDSNCYTLFNDTMQKHTVADSILEANMRKAKLGGEIDTTYDIIYNLRNRTPDALVVVPIWYKTTSEKINLEEYSEELLGCSINIEIGYWKIEASLRDLHHIDEETALHLNIFIPLNFEQLTDPNLLNFLDVTTVNYHILPSRIFFTIKENVLSNDIQGMLTVVKQLVDNGYGVHLENFGSNYLSNDFVLKNHFTSVSVPSSLIHRISASEYDRFMISTIIKNALSKNAYRIICYGADSLMLAHAIKSMNIDLIAGTLLPQHRNINDLIAILKSSSELLKLPDANTGTNTKDEEKK